MNQEESPTSKEPTAGEKVQAARREWEAAMRESVLCAPLRENGTPNPNFDQNRFGQASARLLRENINYQNELSNWDIAHRLHKEDVEEYFAERKVFFSQVIDHAKWLLIIASALVGFSLQLYPYFAERNPLSWWQSGAYASFLICMVLTVLATLAAWLISTKHEETSLREKDASTDLGATQFKPEPDREEIARLKADVERLNKALSRWLGRLEASSWLFAAANFLLMLGIVLLAVFILSNVWPLAQGAPPGANPAQPGPFPP